MFGFPSHEADCTIMKQLVCILCVLAAQMAIPVRAAERPNIVVILADDWDSAI